MLGLVGLAVLVALATYDPRDPSLNTATSRHVGNLAGPAGAVLADFLLQGFGIVGVLPGLAMLTWCWRIASRRGSGQLRPAPRGSAGGVAACWQACWARLPIAPGARPWPVMAGLGGSIGQIVAAAGLEAGHSLFGVVGEASVWLLGAALAVVLTLMSLGLSRSEWSSAGRAAALAARYSVSGGRSAVGGVSSASGWLVNLVNREPPGWRRTIRLDEPTPLVRPACRACGRPNRPREAPSAENRPRWRSSCRRRFAASVRRRRRRAQAAAGEPAAGRGRLEVSADEPAEGPARPRR